MNRNNRGMPELRHAASLAQKTLHFTGARQVSIARNFDRHDAVQFRIAGLVDRSERASPNLGQYFVAAEILLKAVVTPTIYRRFQIGCPVIASRQGSIEPHVDTLGAADICRGTHESTVKTDLCR